jgi:hypothetical protein
MSYVFVLPREIVERLYTQCCDCFDFAKSLSDLEAVKQENNFETYYKELLEFVIKYIKNIFLHTSPIPLLEKKPCRQKDFVLSNNLVTILKIHIEILELFEQHLKEEKAKKFQVIIPAQQSDLLEIFGNPTLITKSIEIFNYIDFNKTFLEGTLKLYSELVKTYTPADPKTLISQLKFLVLSLRIITTYKRIFTRNVIIPTTDSNEQLKLELHSDTSI